MLQADGHYRGKQAVHVNKHPKLGRHRTIIKGALPLVNRLMADQRVKRVNLGKVSALWPPREEQWFRCELTGQDGKLKLLMMDGRALQWLTVELMDKAAVERVTEEIRHFFCAAGQIAVS